MKAARWYWLAADQEHALAQYNPGWMHANGRGVKLRTTKKRCGGTGWRRTKGMPRRFGVLR